MDKSRACSVNGKRVLEPSHPVDPHQDKVLLDGEKVVLKKKIYILLNKPRGVVTTEEIDLPERPSWISFRRGSGTSILSAGWIRIRPVFYS